jgi:hypothetical protein
LEVLVRTFLKQWLWLSVTLVAVHYIIVIWVFGHDAPAVDYFLVAPPATTAAQAIVIPLQTPYPKYLEYILGPLFALWYFGYHKHLVWNKWWAAILLVATLSVILATKHLGVASVCFFFIGQLIGKRYDVAKALPHINLIGYSYFCIAVVFSLHGPGLMAWAYCMITTIIGFGTGRIHALRNPKR